MGLVVCRHNPIVQGHNVAFEEWTRDDWLRQPVFLGMREDKNPGEVVREKTS
jgi:ATP-dependent DNA ligase